MKKQRILLLVSMLALLGWLSLSAQPIKVNFARQYEDVVIPSDTKAKYLRLEAVGGDGGKIARNNQWGGGKGAFVSAYFKIGSNTTTIQPGGTLRFIVGGQGDSKTDMDNADGVGVGGGGGTGIAYKAPGQGNWKLLLVAGGGGGAAWGGLDGGLTGGPGKAYTKNSIGTGGVSTDTEEGKVSIALGVDYEYSSSSSKGSGAGAFVSSDQTVVDTRSNAGWPTGPDQGAPTGGDAHDDGRPYYYSGGWGFGAGGIGKRQSLDGRSGGGGGFSGGKAGSLDGASEGGTSFIHGHMEVSFIVSFARGTDKSPNNGYASYEFVEDEFSSLTFKAANKNAYCIGTSNGSTSTNTELSLVPCSNATNTKSWVNLEHNQVFSLNDATGKCMNIPKRNVGTVVQLHDCNNIVGQQWIYDGGTQQIRFFNDKAKCLSWDKDDLKIKLASCADIPYQKWSVEGASTFDLGENRVATIRSMKDQNQCIDNKGGQIVDGNPIQLSHCAGTDGNDNQKWFFDGLGIRLSEARDKCLDVPSTTNGTHIQLYYCHGTDHGAESHEWIYDGLTNMIRYRDNLNKCLSTDGYNTADGASILIQDCNSALDELKWTLEPAVPHPNDAVFGEFKLEADPSRCINLKDGNASNTGIIQTLTCNGSQTQGWFVQDKKIKLAKDQGFCFALTGDNGDDEDKVHLWQCKDKSNEEWIFDANYRFIRSRVNASKCLYVDGSNNIKLTTCNYTNPIRMQWTLPGNYSERLSAQHQRIHLVKDEGKCVDMKENKKDGNLRVWDCEENNSQYFVFEGPRIRRNDSNLCVDIHTTNPGENIRLWPCNDVGIDTRGQAWFYDAVSGRIHSNADPTKCMRFDSGQAKNFANIKLGTCDDSIAEIFVIK